MIVTSIDNFGLYTKLHPLFEMVNKELISNAMSAYTEEILLNGRRLYASPARCAGKRAEDALLEAHDRYIDVQVCLEGEERMGWRNRAECTNVAIPYQIDRDIVFYNDKPSMYITLKPNQVAVFFPNDAHAPLIGEGMIRKVVFKVLLESAP